VFKCRNLFEKVFGKICVPERVEVFGQKSKGKVAI
jgi:hypothetical protein